MTTTVKYDIIGFIDCKHSYLNKLPCHFAGRHLRAAAQIGPID